MEATSALESWRGTGTILVVDDDEIVRTVTKKILESASFQVVLAADGCAAVELFRQHARDIRVVLLDLTMPRMGGEETLRELRLICPEVPVLIMSGYNEQDVVDLFEGQGLSGFVPKPFRRDSLLGALRRVLPQ